MIPPSLHCKRAARAKYDPMKVDDLFRASILDPTAAVHSARVSTINCPVASDLTSECK